MGRHVARSTERELGELSWAAVAQLVERVLGKDEVMGPNPISSSIEQRQSGWL